MKNNIEEITAEAIYKEYQISFKEKYQISTEDLKEFLKLGIDAMSARRELDEYCSKSDKQ